MFKNPDSIDTAVNNTFDEVTYGPTSKSNLSIPYAYEVSTILIRNNFPSGFHEEIGLINVLYGRTEYLLKLLHKEVFNKDFYENIKEIEASDIGRGLKKLCTLLIKKIKEKEEKEPIILVLEKIKLLMTDERNDISHSFWTTKPEGIPFRIRMSTENGGFINWEKSEEIPLETLRDIRCRFDALFKELLEYRQKLRTK